MAASVDVTGFERARREKAEREKERAALLPPESKTKKPRAAIKTVKSEETFSDGDNANKGDRGDSV